MSVVIKSNNVSNNNFGQLKMLGTTAQEQFELYKQRVQADGGIVKDEAYTLKVFERLFNSNLYGNIASYVSGRAGVKMSGTGVSKLYAIDGDDLVAHNTGNGSLPTLTADNAIDFRQNTSVFYTTESKISLSKNGNFGILASIKDNSIEFRPSTTSVLFASTLHSEVNFDDTTVPLRILDSDKVVLQTSKPEINLESMPVRSDSMTLYKADSISEMRVCFISLPNQTLKYGYRNGSLISTQDTETSKTFTNLADFSFYLDFGGATYGQRNLAYTGVVFDFAFIKDVKPEQASELSRTL